MNIFYFDKNPRTCAAQHCDKHVVKMILEYAQLLSTAHRVLDGKQQVVLKNNRKKTEYILDGFLNDSLYAATHINHPSAKWVRNSSENYKWLFSLFIELLNEYTYRYNKVHACARLVSVLYSLPNNIPDGKFESPWRAMPEQYLVDKSLANYCELSYHLYFKTEKQRMAQWKNREVPEWYI